MSILARYSVFRVRPVCGKRLTACKIHVSALYMDSLPIRVVNTESKKFYTLDSAAKRGEVVDKGFACLSYTWRETGKDKGKAVIDGITAHPEVRRNLMGAIRYAESIGVRYLWVDALCMDQNNNDEIQEEVERMHMYFTVCNLVMVWTSKEQFVCLPSSDFEKALEQFVQSEWLSRSWTIQEGVLASRLVVATDWGLIFPDALYDMRARKEIKPNKGLSILLDSRHRRPLIASDVLELAKDRGSTRVIDKVQSLSAMLPCTRHLQLDKRLGIEYAEEVYFNTLFADKDVSPLCCFIDYAKNQSSTCRWSWMPDFSAYAFPGNVRLCTYNAPQAQG